MNGGPVLALDIGGTTVRAAVIDGGRILQRTSRATASGELGALVVDAAAELVAVGPAWGAVGVGLPEYVDHGTVTSAEVVAWSESIASDLSRIGVRRRVPVAVDSDVRCAAEAEWRALGRPESVLYLSWGTGLSMTLVDPSGRPWSGARGRAIAVGDWPADGSTVERLASGAAIARRYEAASARSISTIEICERALAGDELASAIVDDAARHVADAAFRLALALDPHHLIVGGGIGASHSILMIRAFEAYGVRASSTGIVAPSRPRLGADSGLQGAALVAERTLRR